MWLFLDGAAGVGSVAVDFRAPAASAAASASIVDLGVVVVVLTAWDATNALYELA